MRTVQYVTCINLWRLHPSSGFFQSLILASAEAVMITSSSTLMLVTLSPWTYEMMSHKHIKKLFSKWQKGITNTWSHSCLKKEWLVGCYENIVLIKNFTRFYSLQEQSQTDDFPKHSWRTQQYFIKSFHLFMNEMNSNKLIVDSSTYQHNALRNMQLIVFVDIFFHSISSEGIVKHKSISRLKQPQ